MRLNFLSTLLYLFICTGYIQASITIECPADLTFPCTVQTNDLSVYGSAFIVNNGKKTDAGPSINDYNLNTCNVGTIIRTWETKDEDQQLISCSQTITLLAGEFTEADNIIWPETDLELSGCSTDIDLDDLPIEYREPRILHVMCSQVGTSMSDQILNVGSDCRKILRTWTVINWCTFNPNTNEGKFTFVQVFIISNGAKPEIKCPTEFIVDALDCDSSFVNVPFVSVFGESCSGGFQVTNNSIFADTTSHDASGIYPIGRTSFDFEVLFGCGQKERCRTTVVVTDNVRPVPYCLATINIVLWPEDTDGDGEVDNGRVELWGSDVNINSFHPCHNRPLDFSFRPDSLNAPRTFTCQEVGLNDIPMYVTDDQGRQSYCRVHVVVQNNGANIPNCAPLIGTRAIASGLVTDPIGEPIEDVMISHRDQAPQTNTTSQGVLNQYQLINSIRTTTDGSYSTDDLTLNRDYMLYAYKEGDVSRVDDTDISILEGYIRGERFFTNAYTYMAADINEDGRVDIEDFHLLVNLQGLSESEWPEERQWVFYTKNSVDIMPDPEENNNMNLHQSYEINRLYYGYAENKHFIGVLKGDLDYYERL